MKILLIITVISLLLNIESFAQWEIQVSPEDHLPNLNSVFLFTDSIGVAIGQNGTILKTYNGGDVWYKINSPTNQNLHDLSFINSDEGWAIGDSIILNTTNGGDSWSFKKLTQPLSFEQASGIFTQIQFLDDKNGWIAGNASSAFGYQEYVILKTSDGGANWDTLGPYSGYEILYDLIFINQNLGWRLGGHSRMDQGYIWITDNGGNEWTKQLFHSKAHLRSGFFIDTQTGWVVGNKLYILKTEDGGISWDERNFSNQFLDRFNCVHFANKTHGCAVGSSGKLYFTTNGGDNWNEEYSNVMVTLNSVFLLNDSTGWAVGNNGAIINQKLLYIIFRCAIFTGIASGINTRGTI